LLPQQVDVSDHAKTQLELQFLVEAVILSQINIGDGLIPLHGLDQVIIIRFFKYRVREPVFS
jgi:hypothetical protein